MLRELATGVWVEDGYEGGNVGVILSDRGAVLVDTPMLPPDARAWKETLGEMGAGHVYVIVNTDYHPERMLGNVAFAPVRTVGHEAAQKPIAKYNAGGREQLAAGYRTRSLALAEEIARTELALPEVAVDDRLTLHLGDRTVHVLFLEGHTPASLGVYLPAERILFAGDNVTHYQEPVMYQGNSLAWIGTLERIQAMPVDRIVPGEGEVCDKDVLDPLIAHTTEMRARVLDLFRKGASRRECVEKLEMEERFPVPDDQAARIRRRRRENLERVYTEIRISERRS